LREVLEELLVDAGWREHLGTAARTEAYERLSSERAVKALAGAYAEAMR
jgi:hypothetical protein